MQRRSVVKTLKIGRYKMAVHKRRADRLYRIVVPFGAWGIIVRDKIVMPGGAPMGGWMVGRTIGFVKKWIRRRYGEKGSVERVEE